ncbi:MAG: ribonuclease HI [Anaerolineae bacterium]|jgi:ribonuclease HI
MQQTLFEARDAPTVTVYTDGGCDPNPGPGGWAAILDYGDHEVVLRGNAPDSTNNRMEIEAATSALAYLLGRHGRCHVELYTDSRYLRQGITGWIDDWFARGWVTKGGAPVKNQDAWRQLYELSHMHTVSWHWLRGHAGDPLNERADWLARAARRRLGTTTAPGTAPAEAVPRDPAVPLVELSIGVSCIGSRGPGAWAVVMRDGEARTLMQGSSQDTTSNALYLEAATESLRAVDDRRPATVYAPSLYLVSGASEWISGWQRNGWRTKGGSEVKNREAWEALLRAAAPHAVSWKLVQESGGDDDVSEARRIAGQEAARLAG